MAQPSSSVAPSPLESLRLEPDRFDLDAAAAVLIAASGRADPAAAVRFKAMAGMAYPAADVTAVQGEGTSLEAVVAVTGLTGPTGLLARTYSDTAIIERRRRSTAFSDFLDVLSQRALGAILDAAMKYRPHLAAGKAQVAARRNEPDAGHDPMRDVLLALTGYATPNLAARLPTGTDPLLFYAGHFSAWPRSAERLSLLLSDWLGQPVEVEQFAGTWLKLGMEDMSRLPIGEAGQFNQLGVDAALGERAWDIQSRIVLRIGPLDLEGFRALLPDGALLSRLASLVRSYLGPQLGFAINLVLAAPAVPLPATSGPDAARLGWSAWLPTSGGRTRDAHEALFESDLIERQGAAA